MTARRLLCVALPLFGCGNDDDQNPPVEEGPVYVMMTQVYTVDDRTIYFSSTDSLDVDGVSFADAIERPSVANFTTLDGKLYISSGEEPKITQFDVLGDRTLSQTGEISFAAFPLGDNANFYYHYIVDANLAYLPYETTKRIAWSPADMTILGDETDSTQALMEGPLTLNSGGNRTAVKYPSGPVLQPFFFADETFQDLGTNSRIARYDTTSHAEAEVLVAPCIGLTLTTRDEDGNTYFSSNAYSPLKKLYNIGDAPCVLRVTPAGVIDNAWTNDLSALTGGRYAMNFRYLANGLAVANVLDHDALGLDFTQTYDPAVEDMIYTPGMFELWLFDLEGNTAKPIEGIDLPVDSGGQTAVIDGRMFVFVVFNEYGNTRIYEVSEAGVATPKFDVDGDVFKWERLR